MADALSSRDVTANTSLDTALGGSKRTERVEHEANVRRQANTIPDMNNETDSGRGNIDAYAHTSDKP